MAQKQKEKEALLCTYGNCKALQCFEGEFCSLHIDHRLTIISLHDAQLECSCGWSLVFTGEKTKAEALRDFDNHLYDVFRREWRETHSISSPPSFYSWKTNYKKS